MDKRKFGLGGHVNLDQRLTALAIRGGKGMLPNARRQGRLKC
jgi:hypothetical protein